MIDLHACGEDHDVERAVCNRGDGVHQRSRILRELPPVHRNGCDTRTSLAKAAFQLEVGLAVLLNSFQASEPTGSDRPRHF